MAVGDILGGGPDVLSEDQTTELKSLVGKRNDPASAASAQQSSAGRSRWLFIGAGVGVVGLLLGGFFLVRCIGSRRHRS